MYCHTALLQQCLHQLCWIICIVIVNGFLKSKVPFLYKLLWYRALRRRSYPFCRMEDISVWCLLIITMSNFFSRPTEQQQGFSQLFWMLRTLNLEGNWIEWLRSTRSWLPLGKARTCLFWRTWRGFLSLQR